MFPFLPSLVWGGGSWHDNNQVPSRAQGPKYTGRKNWRKVMSGMRYLTESWVSGKLTGLAAVAWR